MSIFLVSYITSHNDASRNLEASLKKYNYNYKFIGIGEKWKGFVQGKIKSLYNYLSSHLGRDHDIVCIVDGYDILANGPPEELRSKYEKEKCEILYGCEKFCFSYNGIPIDKYKNFSLWSVRKHLNGGFCIGKRESILKLYKWIIEHDDCNDDQKLACRYANIFKNKIKIDLHQNIVFNTITRFDTNNFIFKNKRIYIPSFNSFPCFIHFPSSEADKHERFNHYGKYILGKKFIILRSNKTSYNFFAHFELYIAIIFLLLNVVLKLILVF